MITREQLEEMKDKKAAERLAEANSEREKRIAEEALKPQLELEILNLLKWSVETLEGNSIDDIALTIQFMMHPHYGWKVIILTKVHDQKLLSIHHLSNGNIVMTYEHNGSCRFLGRDMDAVTQTICDELTSMTANSEGKLAKFHD
jgi:hypothetical protein